MYSLNGMPFFIKKNRTRSDGRTNERTDGRSDYIMPKFLFGGINYGCTIVRITKVVNSARYPFLDSVTHFVPFILMYDYIFDDLTFLDCKYKDF